MNPNRKRLTLALSLMGGMLFISSIFALHGALLTSIIRHFHLESSAQGLPSSLAFAGSCAALVMSFAVIGRVSRPTMLKCASGACAAMLAILSFAPTFATYLIAWLLVGVALGFMDTLLSSTMATLYSGKMAMRMMCTMHMLYGVGSMLFPPAYAFLMRSGIAWNRVYLFTAGLGALICLAFTVFARGAGEILPKNEPEFSFSLLKTLLKNGVLPLLMIANFCNGVFMGGATTWLNRYVELRFDVSLGDLALSFLFLGVLASRLLLPMTPIDPKNYLIGAGPLAFIAFLFVILIPSRIVTCVGISLAGLILGAMIPCMLDFGCSTFPENTLMITTPMFLAYSIGQTLGSPAVGFLESHISLAFGVGTCAAFLAVNSFFCLLAARRQRNQQYIK